MYLSHSAKRVLGTLLLVFASAGMALHGVPAQAHGLGSTGQARGHMSVTAPALNIDRLLALLIPAAHAAVKIRVDKANGYRFVESDGLPEHQTGQFPNRGNPNRIQAQNHRLRMRLQPGRSSAPTPVGHNTFGVAINGVLFDSATAEYWNNDRSADWNIEALTGGINLGLDQNNAHVQPSGAYHYHGVPEGLMASFDYRSRPVLLGYAADGFPIYGPYSFRDPNDARSPVVEIKPSYQLKQGERPGGSSGPGGRYDGTYTRDWQYAQGLGELDRCNGRAGVTPEYPQGTYYYVITTAFPFIPRCWQGEADASFMKRGAGRGGNARNRQSAQGAPRGGAGSGGSRRRPPPEAISACRDKAAGVSCAMRTRRGEMTGTCRAIGEETACVPQRP